MSKEEHEKDWQLSKAELDSLRQKISWGFTSTHTDLPENFYGENLATHTRKSNKTPPDPTTTERSSTRTQERGGPTDAEDCGGEYYRVEDKIAQDWYDFELPEEIGSPSYYTVGTREAIDYMRDQGILTEYAIGNVIKYIMRFRHKGTPIDDLNKAIRYIQILIEEVEDEKSTSGG